MLAEVVLVDEERVRPSRLRRHETNADLSHGNDEEKVANDPSLAFLRGYREAIEQAKRIVQEVVDDDEARDRLVGGLG